MVWESINKMKKKIIVTETQYKNLILQESTREDFSLAEMDSIKDPYERCAYCMKYLGEEIGEGSSRTVFLLSDEHVLKIACGHSSDSGAMQNKVEWDTLMGGMQNSILFPKVYQHADDFSWIIVEHVVDATILDFSKILGIPFDDPDEGDRIKGDVKDIPVEDDGKYVCHNYDNDTDSRELRWWALDDYRDYEKYGYPVKTYDDNEEPPSFMGFIRWLKNPRVFFNSTVDYKTFFLPSNPNYKWWIEIARYYQFNQGIVDFDIDNFGMALRNGQPTIVLLDSGFNTTVKEQYY